MGELSLNVVTLSLLVMFMGAELVMLCPTCRLSMTTIAEHADLPVVGIALRPLQAPSPFPPWHGLAGGWMLGFSGDLLSATLSNTFTGASVDLLSSCYGHASHNARRCAGFFFFLLCLPSG
uniref:Uncharacterized protein n=1 Tax=Oryza rufipogon TaxID=4529 RepID=A0A0E0PNK7_ORYRU